MLTASFRLKSFLSACLVMLFAVFSSAKAWANTEEHGAKFNAGEMIGHHIVDAHEWHFFSIGDKHFSIHLPVIVKGPDGVKVYSSSVFHQAAAPSHESHASHGAAHAANPEFEGYAMNMGHGAIEVNGKKVGAGKIYRPDGQDFINLSITKNVASMLISAVLLIGIFLSIAGAYGKDGLGVPKGLASFFEPVIVFVRDDIAKTNIGPKYERFLPYLLTLFFFIWFNNLLGLLPGGANLTGNISVTLVLALLTFIITTFSANGNYWAHIFNTPGVPWWLKFGVPIMPIVELVGMFVKPFSLMVRLFANILAGHVIILSLLSLTFIFQSLTVGFFAAAFSSAMMILEFLVALIQAYVFTLLTSLYFGSAVEEHHHDEHEHAHGAAH